MNARAVAGHAALLALSLVFLIPLAWMISTSFETDAAAVAAAPHLFVRHPTLQAYRAVLDAPDAPVFRWFVNSLLAAAAQAALVVATAAPAAYALARLRVRGSTVVLTAVTATLFVPPIVLLAPSFMVVQSLGWIDTLWAVIVPGAASAFGVFFLHQFFAAIPRELEEAARLDRANRLQIFWHVVLPLSRPALATLALLSFLTNWNDFLWPLYVLLNPRQLTLPSGLSQLQGAYTTHYPNIMAGAVVASLPVLLLFVLAQRYVIEGVARQGLKG